MPDVSRARRDENERGSMTALLRVTGPTHGHPLSEARQRMRTIRVRLAMKPVPVGIPTSATLEEAEERMDHDGVNWLPVVERGRLVGLITRLDLRQAVTGPR